MRQPILDNISYKALLDDFLLYQRNKSKESTCARYESIIRRHIIPHFGELKLNEITSSKVELFTREKLLNGCLNKDGGLSPKRVRDILSVLKQSLIYAAERGFSVNTVKISFPRIESPKIDSLTIEEEAKLISYALNEKALAKFGMVIALYTGLRIGELCALRWNDIDFENQTLNVNKTLQRIADLNQSGKTKIIIDKPKSKASERIIPLPQAIMLTLTLYKQMAQMENGYVLTGTQKYIEPSNYYTMYQKWLQDCNISQHSFHTLRHTFATRCIENGFDPKVLSEILGHSDVKITLSCYVHPSMEFKRSNMEKLSVSISSHTECHF